MMKNIGTVELTEQESLDLLNSDFVIIERDNTKYMVVYNVDEEGYFIGELVTFEHIQINA